MSTSVNLIIQYAVVGALLIGVLIWTVRRFLKLRKQGKSPGCSGCALADACTSKAKAKTKNGQCTENNITPKP